MFENIFTLTKDKKKTRKLKDIQLSEISMVDNPASQISFIIIKRQNGEQLNDLDELISCETFTTEQAEQIDKIMKQLGDIDSDTAEAIGVLVLAVSSDTKVAKSCEEIWPSISGIELIEIECLVSKSELNIVEQFIQKFVTKKETNEDELDVINAALETIADLDGDSINAVYNLLKIKFAKVGKLWPSFFKHIDQEYSDQEYSEQEDSEQGQEQVSKSGLKWPSISGR